MQSAPLTQRGSAHERTEPRKAYLCVYARAMTRHLTCRAAQYHMVAFCCCHWFFFLACLPDLTSSMLVEVPPPPPPEALEHGLVAARLQFWLWNQGSPPSAGRVCTQRGYFLPFSLCRNCNKTIVNTSPIWLCVTESNERAK
jgi:hypothetical protein